MKNRKQPEIRFSGYSYEWKVQVLRDVVERVTRKNKDLKTQLPLTISAQYGLVDQVSYFNKQVASKDMSNYYLLERGEFAYNKSYSRDYPWGAIKRLDKYDMGALSSLYITFKPFKVDSNFLVSYYDTNKWHKEVSTRATEGARNHGLLNISANDFLETELVIPLQEEQESIGSFLKQLDESITLYQQELDTLKQTKQGFFQKMFPKEGEFVPEFRFPGFTDNWKWLKFENFISKAGKKNAINENYPAYSVSNKVGLVRQNEQFDGSRLDGLDKASYKIVNPKEFVYNPSRINVGSIAFNYLNEVVIVSSLYVVIKMSEELDNNFILQYIKSGFFTSEVKKNTEGSVREYLFFENFKNLKFPYTSNKDEQSRIGNFFNQLDKVIVRQEEKLEILKQTKKAFLQKMFV